MASAHCAIATITAVEYYRRRFHTLDSDMVWMPRPRAPVKPQIWMNHQYAKDIADPDHRELSYTNPGIRERTSLLPLNEDGLCITISFSHNLALAPFVTSDFDAVGGCALVLNQAVIAHIKKTARTVISDALHHRILTNLEHRERRVITYLLTGQNDA